MAEPGEAAFGSRPARRAKVDRIFDHNPDTRSLFLTPIDSRPVRFVPGQFISIAIVLPDETRTRAYTIASRPEDGAPFEICFNRVVNGRGVEWLFQRQVGDALDFIGPFGSFTMERPPDADLVFIADGTAIAPIRPMIHRVMSMPNHRRVNLLYVASKPEHLLYRDEFESYAASTPQFAFDTMIAARTEMHERLLEEVDRRWVKADADRTRQFYVCGVGKGVVAIRDVLRSAGYERRAVHYEQW